MTSHSYRFAALAILVASATFPCSRESRASAQPPPASVTVQSPKEDYAAELDKVWRTVRDRFWDKQLNGVDWSKIGEKYKALLPSVKSKTEFSKLVNRMLSELHASHTTYVNDDDYEFYMLPEVMERDMSGHQVEHIGVMGREVAGGYQVTAVFDNGPAQRAGIHAGDQIVSADGAPFTTAGSFKGKDGKPVQIAIKRYESDSIQTIAVTPVKQNLLKAFLDATRASARIIDVRGKKIAYVHLWTMANDRFKAALDDLMLNKLHDTDGLILDLRDGFGGTPFGYTDVLCRPDVAWESQYRGGQPGTTHTGYSKPIVALINEGTRSAKEFLCYQLKTTHRATIVGKQTAGAFLGAGSFNISDTGLLEMAIIGLKVDGKKLEATGVTPDVDVDAGYSYTDRDLQMSAATNRLLDEIQKAPYRGF